MTCFFVLQARRRAGRVGNRKLSIAGESVRKLVTPLLNFAAWLLGFSEDPEASEYVEDNENQAVKIFSFCQDLINVSRKGKIQTPKSLALVMAVSTNYRLFKSD